MFTHNSHISADVTNGKSAYAVCRFVGESPVVEAAGVAVNDNESRGGMGQSSDVKKLVRRILSERGWSLEVTKKHWKLRHPQGTLVSFSATPSDTNAVKNIRRDINRVLKKWGEQTI